jgi:hypothetical protein
MSGEFEGPFKDSRSRQGPERSWIGSSSLPGE